MKSNSVLIVGCGDLGARAGLLLQAQEWAVAGVRRHPAGLPTSFGGHAADYTVQGSLGFIEALQPDYVLATLNPADRSVAGYRAGFAAAVANLLAGLGEHKPQHIIAVSSTRVFAERAGAWVDEQSPLSTDDPRALAMIEAEQSLLASSHSVCVVRFGGIYGAADGRLLSRIAGGDVCAAQPLRYSNRIHRDDCAGFLVHLLQLAAAGNATAPVYVGVDDQPAPQFEVESWLARELGVEVRVGSEPLAHGPGGHKRCSNRLLRDSGYQLLYPCYRSGYRAVLRAR